jgi:hypothetical protein
MQTMRDTKIKTSSADEALTALTRLLARQAAREWSAACDAPAGQLSAVPSPDKKVSPHEEQ